MKFNTILISLFFILFQSCYSYKKLDFKSNETHHHEQIKIKLKNSKKIKGLVIKTKNDSIYLQKKQKTIKISQTEIEQIKKREFSWSKTTILSITYSFGLILFITVTTILTPFL